MSRLKSMGGMWGLYNSGNNMSARVENVDRAMSRINKALINAQSFYTQTLVSKSNVYIPTQSGDLKRSVRLIKDGSTPVGFWYDSPYANRQYVGTTEMGVAYKRQPSRNPRGQSRWIEVAFNNHRNELERGIVDIMNKGTS